MGVETAMHEGLGAWYAFMGPFDVEHINSDGRTLLWLSLWG